MPTPPLAGRLWFGNGKSLADGPRSLEWSEPSQSTTVLIVTDRQVIVLPANVNDRQVIVYMQDSVMYLNSKKIGSDNSLADQV